MQKLFFSALFIFAFACGGDSEQKKTKNQSIGPEQRELCNLAFTKVEEGKPLDIEDLKPLIKCRNEIGWTLIHTAAAHGNQDAFDLLKNSEFNLDVRSSLTGKTPIHAVALAVNFKEKPEKYKEILRDLLASGLDINEQDETGETPLYTAAEFGTVEMVQLLLQAGADPSISNDYRQLPYHVAGQNVRGDSIEIRKLLSP